MVHTMDSSGVSRTSSSILRLCSRCHSWWRSQERSATRPASVMLDILAGTKNKTAAEVAVEFVTEAPRISGPKVLYAVLAASTAGRAKVIVREDAWAWARLRERFGRTRERRVSQKCFNTVGRARSREDVWREWVKKVSKLPHGSLRSQAIEQLTFSGMSRHG